MKRLKSLSKRPKDLLGKNAEELKRLLEIEENNAERIARLLDRGGAIAIKLERLESQGIHVLTRADPDYPTRYKERLKEKSPVILFYAGEKALLGQPGIAVVGSRNLDNVGEKCAEFVGNVCGVSGLVLYSGGAKGVDTISMKASLDVQGHAVGILANALTEEIKDPQKRKACSSGHLCLVTPYSPDAPFSVGAAMGRNKLIYALADYAIVVVSDVEKGGTWAGAIEALKAKWVPVFVVVHDQTPPGNQKLIEQGALQFPHPFPESPLRLKEWLKRETKTWLERHSAAPQPDVTQPPLFDPPRD
ncbi:DNA-processing protein DprA [Anaerolinea thermophila]|uniref:DNA-processing protein DprA n=2 Tax=Anaerolinea TaxID=233189 RepID=UPI0026F2E490|nr:DNA-processing protein DprA [Anaerolinea thermophila]